MQQGQRLSAEHRPQDILVAIDTRRNLQLVNVKFECELLVIEYLRRSQVQLEHGLANLQRATYKLVDIGERTLLNELHQGTHGLFAENRWHATSRIGDNDLVAVVWHGHYL